MDKKTGIIIGTLVAAFIALVGISITQRNSYNYSSYSLTDINPADDASGGLAETIAGSPDAPVKIIEYGNYQCSGCAATNPKINDLLAEYGDKVVLIFRNMSLPGHDNGKASAAAALAAAQQGYWKEYKDYLYANQSDWYYATGTDRQAKFEQYFLTVANAKAAQSTTDKAKTDNPSSSSDSSNPSNPSSSSTHPDQGTQSVQGDLAKFRADMASDAVKQKLVFDEQLAARAGAEWSPYFTIDGENISQQNISTEEFLDNFRAKIDAKLATSK